MGNNGEKRPSPLTFWLFIDGHEYVLNTYHCWYMCRLQLHFVSNTLIMVVYQHQTLDPNKKLQWSKLDSSKLCRYFVEVNDICKSSCIDIFAIDPLTYQSASSMGGRRKMLLFCKVTTTNLLAQKTFSFWRSRFKGGCVSYHGVLRIYKYCPLAMQHTMSRQ